MMCVLVSLLQCILVLLLLLTSGSLLTLTLGLKEEDANMRGSCIENERQALLDVKANLVDLYGCLGDWRSQGENYTDCCKWAGVRCSNLTGHVIELVLTFTTYKSFRGTISPSLQVLNQLQYLNLSRIDFQSNLLPNFLGTLSNLQRLDISSANLSGPIPDQLGNLTKLFHLDLSDNRLGSFVPFFFGELTSLTYLDLSQNQLGGDIPKSFGNCSSLAHLDLSHNFLNGPLPSFVGCSSLIFTMSLDHKSFNGSMVQKLDLSPNFLSGNMSKSVDQLSYLDVSHNYLNGNMSDLTEWPDSLFVLDISSNKFFGNVPNSLVRLSKLYFIDVSNNSLYGMLPNFTGWPSLVFLDMSSNKFYGNIPNKLGQLSNLEYLDFSSNMLEGVISEVHFQNLTQLFYLDLSFNSLVLDLSFHGRIPSPLSTIKLQSCKLGRRFPMWIKTQRRFSYLDISNAGISDVMPAWFWDLPGDLRFLNISSNEIKGMIPNVTTQFGYNPIIDLSNNHFEGRPCCLPSMPATLNLSRNRFSGTLSFLCDIVNLFFLDLSNNLFSGTLPNCWLNFQKTLVMLNLSNNNLSGEIPSSLGLLLKLKVLYLRTNAFVGEFPTSLCNCTGLRFLDLGENRLSGVIPEFIGNDLSELYVLVLGSNSFYGRLPTQVCWLYNLQVLDLSNNRLSGNIPRCFVNFTAMAKRSFGDNVMTRHFYTFIFREPSCKDLSKGCPPASQEEAQFFDNAWVTWKGRGHSFGKIGLQLLKSIDLSRNNLFGKLPHEITSLYDLASLNLSTNKLYGEVPNDIGRLKSLQALDLSKNKFSGHIPRSLAYLNFLSYLDLSNNNLSGRIPTGSQLQLFITSYSHNPQLCGPPVTPRCGLSPPPTKKDVEDDSWKSYYIGMGAGFAVGISGICGALVLNHRCRRFFFASLSHMKDWIYVTVVVYFGKLERKFRM